MRKRKCFLALLAMALIWSSCANEYHDNTQQQNKQEVFVGAGEEKIRSGEDVKAQQKENKPSNVETEIQLGENMENICIENSTQQAVFADKLKKDGIIVIPWGVSLSLDLDGDGIEEKISAHLSIESEYSQNDWRFALPVLTVDEAVFGVEDFYKLCYPDGGLIEGTRAGWCILDIDISDPYLEIGFGYLEGRGHKTYFLRYGQEEFASLGFIETDVFTLEHSYSEFMRDINREGEEPDWEAMREMVLASERGVQPDGVPGDGTLYFGGYHEILEYCENGKMGWRLENSQEFHTKLVQEPEYLEFGEFVRNVIPMEKVLLQDTAFYLHKGGEDGETVILPAGTEVWFRRYYPEGRWMEMTYDKGGIYKDGKQSAWFQVVEELGESNEAIRGTIRLPDGEMSPSDCFQNLIFGG